MATHVSEIVLIYESAKRDLKRQYPDFSDSLLETMADNAIMPHLRDDKYSVLSTLDNTYTSFLLKNMNITTLIAKLGEMGYKITQPNKDEKVIKAERGILENKSIFSFDLKTGSPFLIVPDGQPATEIKTFLEELYSITSTKQTESLSLQKESPTHEATSG